MPDPTAGGFPLAPALAGELAGRLGPLLTGIDHVGVAVPDLDAGLARWTALGLVERHREENPEQGVVEVMLIAGAPPAGSRPTQLQLLAPLGTTSPVARFLDRRGAGLQHLALGVSDLGAASAALRTAGLVLTHPDGRRGTAGSLINFVHPRCTDGVLLELVQPLHPAR